MAKTKNITNPFSVISYLGADYFCDREKEATDLFGSLKNGRNITLISPRKMGKTGLIKHIFHLNRKENAFFFYIDIYGTTNLAEFTKCFAESVFSQQIATFANQVWKDITTLFAGIRPVITTEPITGAPQCMVDIKPQTEDATLQQIFAYLEAARKPCFVAFDEFQTIADYTDCQMEALLRKHIQQLTNVHFIFAGSKKHVMADMFLMHNRPFYQSTQIMHIGEIDETTYAEFANRHFAKHKQHIAPEVFHELYDLVKGHTWYVQMLLNRLYQLGQKEISHQHILEALNYILEESTPSYQMYLNLITAKQRALLRAIAEEGSIREICGKDFISRHNLGVPSSIKSSLQLLIDKELVYADNGAYSVYDRFFSLWLAM